MNIRKDKPMVLHTKKKLKLRLHKRKIKHGAKKQRENPKASIKVRNRRLRAVAVTGAKMGAGQIEGGEEIQESVEVITALSTPVAGVTSAGGTLYRKRAKKKRVYRDTEYAESSIRTRKKVARENKKDKRGKKGEEKGREEKSGFGINRIVKEKMLDVFIDNMQEEREQKSFMTSIKEAAKASALLLAKEIAVAVAPYILGAFAVIAIVGVIVTAVLTVVYNSPLAIFFELPDTGYDNPRTVLCEYYKEFNQQLTSLEEQGYVIAYQNEEDGVPVSNFNDTLMVYMVKYGIGQAAYVMDEEGRKHLKEVFDEMNYYDSSYSAVKIQAGESLGEVVATGYCPCSICCGSYSNGITASGNTARAKHTIAVDAYNPIVPMGTKIIMDGTTYTVEDTGNLNAHGVDFDIYFSSHQEALNWGKKTIEAYLAEGNENEVEVVTYNVQVHNLTYADYMDLGTLTEEQKEWLKSVMGDELWDTYYVGAGGQAVADLAMTKIGCRYSQEKRYQEGYYDCSSLVQRLYKEIGIELPATASTQGRYCYDNAMIINKKDLKPGDLIFYSYKENGEFRNISHVAIYVGDGKMVHAANENRGVVMDDLRTNSVVFFARPY